MKRSEAKVRYARLRATVGEYAVLTRNGELALVVLRGDARWKLPAHDRHDIRARGLMLLAQKLAAAESAALSTALFHSDAAVPRRCVSGLIFALGATELAAYYRGRAIRSARLVRRVDAAGSAS